MMLNNSHKGKQAKRIKFKSEFDFILEQILNLDTQRKNLKTRSIKSVS